MYYIKRNQDQMMSDERYAMRDVRSVKQRALMLILSFYTKQVECCSKREYIDLVSVKAYTVNTFSLTIKRLDISRAYLIYIVNV